MITTGWYMANIGPETHPERILVHVDGISLVPRFWRCTDQRGRNLLVHEHKLRKVEEVIIDNCSNPA